MTLAVAQHSNIDDLFNKTKGLLFFQKKSAGFLGRILAQVKFSWNSDIPTACISPDELFWNPDFFLSLDKETQVTVLAHELWHNGLLHTSRRGNRCPDIWNQAADHVINLMLKEHGYYMNGFPFLMDPKYIGWSTEEVYDDLITEELQPQANPLGSDIIEGDPENQYEAITKVVSAVSAARIAGEAGSLPGELEQVIDKFLNPKLPWEVLLFNFFNALACDEYSYARPNRRYDDIILPGRTSRNGLEHLVYAVDVSGSITDHEVLMCNSEVKHIQETLNPERLTLITFDEGIRDIFEYERDDPFDKLKIIGRGGTNLTEVFDYITLHSPTAAVIFTDLCVTIPPDPGIPILWICTNNPNSQVPSFGKLIHMEGKE